MEFRVELTPQAEADIVRVHHYIRENSRAAADRWLSGVRVQIASLSSLPTRCPFAPEAEALDTELRQLLYGRRGGIYRIIFRIEPEEPTPRVRVLAVRHGARRPLEPGDLPQRDE